jgi:putative peptidoglycan lipid II flippase
MKGNTGLGEAASSNAQKSSTARVVAKATGLMIITILLSRVLGFARETSLSAYFGRGGLTDIYKLSFTVPDVLYFLIAGGALNSAFIPIFTKYLTEGKEEDAWKVFSVVTCVALSVAAAFIIIGEVFSLQFAWLIAPGFRSRPEALIELAYLTRIVLPAQAFFFLGGLMMGTLYSRNKYFAPAFGPLVYNIMIIAGGFVTARMHAADLHYLSTPAVKHAIHVYCTDSSTPTQIAIALKQAHVNIGHVLSIGTRAVSGYSWGALIGAFIGNVCIQLVVMCRLGLRFKPSFDVAHEGVRKVFALMLPVILGLSLPQVDVIINRYFGNMLAAGTVTALDNANRLMQLPYGVFGQAFGLAIFPTLSALAAKKLWDEYKTQVSQGIRGIVFMTLPASVLMMVLSIPIIRFVFQHGNFTADDTYVTAFTLVLYCAGVFVWSMQAIIARGFYALQDTITVVATGTVVTVLFVLMNIAFVHSSLSHGPLAPGGLALTTTIAAGVHTGVLLWMLRNRMGGIDGRRILTSLGRMFVASGIMAAIVGVVYFGIEHSAKFQHILHGHHVLAVVATFAELLVTGGIGAVVYGCAARLLKIQELEYAVSMFRNRFRRRAAVPAKG